MPKQAHSWEWKAELEEIRCLTTGDKAIGHRVRYREQGARRWRSFLLTTDDGSTPTETMVLRAIELHAGVGGGTNEGLAVDQRHRSADAWRQEIDDHSAGRNVDVLEREAPHLLAPSSPAEASSHDA